jgi:hypothetical protein
MQMREVIERHGHHIDAQGFIHYDDRPSTYEAAEKLAGRRLDRRRVYCIADGEVRELARWSQACSGCHEGHDIFHGAGHGCSECGYTGRRHEAHWVPLTNNNED